MAVRRVNFTGRKRISLADAVISLRPGTDGAADTFDAAFDLGAYKLPPDALVSVEAYRQTTRITYAFGTVARIQPASDRRLDAFDSVEAILFRVRVTDIGPRHGVLLAEADKIRPRIGDDDDADRLPLLPAAPGDLGDEVWRVEIEGKPILRLNELLFDWKEVVRSDQFRALVYPRAVCDVLRYVLADGVRTVEDLDDWRAQWLMFATKIPGVTPIPASPELDADWLQEVATAFARRFRLLDRYQRDFFRNRVE